MSVRSDSEESSMSRPVLGGAASGGGTGTKEALPPRHRRSRRKEEDVTSTQQPPVTAQRDTLIARGAQFDLEEASFPPLPGKK